MPLMLGSHTHITFISPQIYKSSCTANFSEKKNIHVSYLKELMTTVISGCNVWELRIASARPSTKTEVKVDKAFFNE